MKKLKFEELSLSPEILKAVLDMGFEEASPIQSEAIPYLLEGHDLIGQAQTGTGKTAAFGIPIIEMIDPTEKGVQALIMCPTRELAMQVSQEIKKLSKYKKGLSVLPVYGGESIDRQIMGLKKGVNIVIGTPGRILDHMERKTINFSQVRMAVLDEADEMLNMGFRDDIESILKSLPKEKQTILFSATMAKEIMALTKKFQRDPKVIKVTKNELTVSTIEQGYFMVKESDKTEIMSKLIELNDLKLVLVFCNTKRKVDEITEELKAAGLKAEAIHGDLRQNQRSMVMAKFRNGGVNILVATDVAARGIDVNNVDAVFNYDLPQDTEAYVHRIGRTGRAGKEGKSFTFITGRNESGRLRDIEAYTKVKLTKIDPPSAKEIVEYKKKKLSTKIEKLVASKGFDKFEAMVEEIKTEGYTADQIAAALLKMVIGEEVERPERADRGERSDRPSRSRDRDDDGGRRSSREEGKKRPRIDRGKMVRLFVSLGKKDHIKPGDIVGAFTSGTQISGSEIGSIDIFDKYSFVEVPENTVDYVLEGMNQNQIKGKRVNVEVAGK
jgi:ATP-dependent RNA helicase DeaD